jgi:putative transcriptional regulator
MSSVLVRQVVLTGDVSHDPNFAPWQRCRLMTRSGGSVRGEINNGASARIRARRREVGLTQIDLARAADVSRQTIISLEMGDYAPSVYLAIKIAVLLHSTVESLWGLVPLSTATVTATADTPVIEEVNASAPSGGERSDGDE